MKVEFTVNGNPVSAQVEPRTTLSLCLRDSLRLTGTHVGCEHGVCGACTVIIDGEAVRSCLTLAVQVEGREVDLATAPLRNCLTYYNGYGDAEPGSLAYYGGGMWNRWRTRAQESLEPYLFD